MNADISDVCFFNLDLNKVSKNVKKRCLSATYYLFFNIAHVHSSQIVIGDTKSFYYLFHFNDF